MKTCNTCKKEIIGITRVDNGIYSCEKCYHIDFDKRCKEKYKEYLEVMDMVKMQGIEEAKMKLERNGYSIISPNNHMIQTSCCKSKIYDSTQYIDRDNIHVCSKCCRECTLEDIPVKTEDRWNDFYMDKGVYPLHRNRIMFYPEDVVDFIKSERELLVEKIKEYIGRTRLNFDAIDCVNKIIKIIQEK